MSWNKTSLTTCLSCQDSLMSSVQRLWILIPQDPIISPSIYSGKGALGICLHGWVIMHVHSIAYSVTDKGSETKGFAWNPCIINILHGINSWRYHRIKVTCQGFVVDAVLYIQRSPWKQSVLAYSFPGLSITDSCSCGSHCQWAWEKHMGECERDRLLLPSPLLMEDLVIPSLTVKGAKGLCYAKPDGNALEIANPCLETINKDHLFV